MFQFTQPKRAATLLNKGLRSLRGVSIHAAQAGCDIVHPFKVLVYSVSIHAAQAGCDLVFLYIPFDCTFQFTQPKRAATSLRGFGEYADDVSIHAAQAGCDFAPPSSRLDFRRFNSRSPSGLRQHLQRNRHTSLGFNSRSPSGLRLEYRCPRP